MRMISAMLTLYPVTSNLHRMVEHKSLMTMAEVDSRTISRRHRQVQVEVVR